MNIVPFLIDYCILALIVFAFLLVAWLAKNRWLKIGCMVAAAVILTLPVWMSAMSDQLNPFPLLETQADRNSLPGIYEMDSSNGYQLGHITLNADGTYEAVKVPDTWSTGPDVENHNFSGSGTWRVEGSKLILDKGPPSWPEIDLAAPKGKRKDYALVVPISDGSDFMDAHFVKKP